MQITRELPGPQIVGRVAGAPDSRTITTPRKRRSSSVTTEPVYQCSPASTKTAGVRMPIEHQAQPPAAGSAPSDALAHVHRDALGSEVVVRQDHDGLIDRGGY